MRAKCSIMRADLSQALADGRELSLCEPVCLRDHDAHAAHRPERGGVESEPHLIGRRAVTDMRSDESGALCSLMRFSICQRSQ